MKRHCFLLKLKCEMVEAYLADHDVWPEMLDALREAGVRNYSLFLRRGDGLVVGYFEAEDPAAALTAVGGTDVNRRWQAKMARYFESGSGDMKEGPAAELEHYFHLP